jgi:hypothetical protein
MATPGDVRRIARTLPGALEGADGLSFAVRRGARDRGFAWAWRERVAPRRPRLPNPEVLAVRVADLAEKDALLGLDPAKFFTEPHYDGFPAVLVRLRAVGRAELRKILQRAWACVAPPALQRAPPTGRRRGGPAPPAPGAGPSAARRRPARPRRGS